MNDCILTEYCDRTTLSKNLQAFLFEGSPSLISFEKIRYFNWYLINLQASLHLKPNFVGTKLDCCTIKC